MKKYYIILAILGILAGYFSKIDFWFEDARESFFPITKAQLKIKKNSVVPDEQSATEGPSNPSVSPAPAVALDKLSQGELFHELYNAKILKQASNQTLYFEKIRARLSSQYPAPVLSEHKTDYEKEVANRIGLLKAMARFWPSPREVSVDQTVIKQFFFDIAKNKKENFMVRRQAYKNWLTFGDTVSPSDKNRLLASADGRLLHLISLSDENLIQNLTESAD